MSVPTAYQWVGNVGSVPSDYDTSFPKFLKFDGTDDSLSTASIDFTSTAQMSVFSGVRKLSDANIGYVLDHNQPQSNTQAFALTAPQTIATTDVSFRSRGSGNNSFATYSSYAAPGTAVLSGLANIADDVCILRLNGTEVASSATDQGSGNYANAVLNIGRRPAGNNFNGRLYAAIVLGRTATASEITSTEAWVNNVTKAY